MEACFLHHAWGTGVIGPAALWRNAVTGLQALGILPASPGAHIPVPSGLPLLTRLRYAFLSGNKTYLKGVSLEVCRSLAEAAFQQRVLPLLSEKGRDRLRWHRSQGHLVVLLTGTLDFLGKPLQEYLQADRLLAAQPEARDGRMTGRLLEPHPYGPYKRDLVRRLDSLEHLDLSASYAYADHHTDLPVLEEVGHPVVVNPDRRLVHIARERSWPVEEW